MRLLSVESNCWANDAITVLIDTPELAGDAIVYLTQKKQDWLAGRYLSCTWDMPELLAMKDDIVKRNILKFRMAL